MDNFEVFVECIDNAGVIIAKMSTPVHTSSPDYAKEKIIAWIDSSIRGVRQGKTNRLLISFNVAQKGLSLPLSMVNPDVY